MSGRKQHYIPQSLLRGFGSNSRSGNATQVWVYSRTRGAFRTSVEGVGAQRHFYSEQAANNDEVTLDDKITEYDASLAGLIGSLRLQPAGPAERAKELPDALVHLGIRIAHVRDTAVAVTSRLLAEIKNETLSATAMRRQLKIDDPAPSRQFRNMMKDQYQRDNLKARKISFSQYQDWAFREIKKSFTHGYKDTEPLLENAFASLHDNLYDLVKDTQRKVLNETLAPPLRLRSLLSLYWRVIDTDEDNIILPDCVAITSTTKDEIFPIWLSAHENIGQVILPISSNRVVMGYCREKDHLLENLNDHLMASSWDFFISLTDNYNVTCIKSKIGRRLRSVLEDSASLPKGTLTD